VHLISTLVCSPPTSFISVAAHVGVNSTSRKKSAHAAFIACVQPRSCRFIYIPRSALARVGRGAPQRRSRCPAAQLYTREGPRLTPGRRGPPQRCSKGISSSVPPQHQAVEKARATWCSRRLCVEDRLTENGQTMRQRCELPTEHPRYVKQAVGGWVRRQAGQDARLERQRRRRPPGHADRILDLRSRRFHGGSHAMASVERGEGREGEQAEESREGRQPRSWRQHDQDSSRSVSCHQLGVGRWRPRALC
jgi:hypothetical protein